MESSVTATSGDPYGNWSYLEEPILLEEDWQGNFNATFTTVCYSLIFCVSLAGNGFLFWALLRREDLKRTSSLLLLHLTVSDLIFTVPLPVWAAYMSDSWVLGEGACRILNGLFFLGFYSYMTFLTAMTVHRYMAVVHAVASSTYRPGVHLLSAGLWLFCLAFSIPEMVFTETVVGNDDLVYCVQDYGSHIPEYLMYYVQVITFFLVPFAVITFCYTRMWFRIRRCRIVKKNQAERLIFMIVVGFFICWAPYNIFLILYSLDLQGLIPKLEHSVASLAYTMSHTLAYFHCCLSPIIHIFGAGKFRGRLALPNSFRRLSSREVTQTISTHL